MYRTLDKRERRKIDRRNKWGGKRRKKLLKPDGEWTKDTTPVHDEKYPEVSGDY